MLKRECQAGGNRLFNDERCEWWSSLVSSALADAPAIIRTASPVFHWQSSHKNCCMTSTTMNKPLCRQHHRSTIPLQTPTAVSINTPMTCRNRRATRIQRRALKVCAVAADKVSSTVAEIPKVKTNKAKLGEMSPETAKDIYRDMFLGREFEEMCAQMCYRGKMFGFVHLYSGQEAVATGVIRNLRKDDYICSTYRDHVHALSKNVPAKNIMAELFGKKTGICRGQGGSMHMFSAEHGLVSEPVNEHLLL